MTFSRSILCNIGLKGTVAVPLLLRTKLARAPRAHAPALSSTRDAYRRHIIVFHSCHGWRNPLAAKTTQSENSVEAISMPAFKGVSPLVDKILFDLMSQSAKIESALAQQKNLNALSQHVNMLQILTRKVIFAVLQSTAILSISIEEAYLSNSQDEVALRAPEFHLKRANFMKIAVDACFPCWQGCPGKHLAARFIF
jgi:hypothetical protein